MRTAGWFAIGIGGAFLAAHIVAAPRSDARPRYSRSLEMPAPTDHFRQPRAVHADPHTGEVFVCDTRNHRVVIFDSKGLLRFVIRGGGMFRTPIDVAVDPDGYILVLGVRQGTRGLMQLDFDGSFMKDVRLSGLPEESARPDPVSVALSPSGDRLYTLDYANLSLWITDREGTAVGSVDLAENLTEKEARDQLLGHVDVYGETLLVAVPTSGRVHLLDLDGGLRGTVGLKGTASCQMALPVSAALRSDGLMYVLDHQRALFMLWDPRDKRCLGEYSGFGNAPGGLYRPGDLAVDGEDRVYVSQGFEGRVQVFEYPASAPDRANGDSERSGARD